MPRNSPAPMLAITTPGEGKNAEEIPEDLDCRGYQQAGAPVCQDLTAPCTQCQPCSTTPQAVSEGQKNCVLCH